MPNLDEQPLKNDEQSLQNYAQVFDKYKLLQMLDRTGQQKWAALSQEISTALSEKDPNNNDAFFDRISKIGERYKNELNKIGEYYNQAMLEIEDRKAGNIDIYAVTGKENYNDMMYAVLSEKISEYARDKRQKVTEVWKTILQPLRTGIMAKESKKNQLVSVAAGLEYPSIAIPTIMEMVFGIINKRLPNRGITRPFNYLAKILAVILTPIFTTLYRA